MSDDKRSGGDGRKPPNRGKRPFGAKKPFGTEEGSRRRGVDGDAPPRRSFGDRDEGGGERERRSSDRPARSFADRNEGDRPRPFKPREDRASAGEGSRKSLRPREDREGGERPFKSRAPVREQEGRDAPRKPLRDREGGGERPFRGRSRDESGDAPRGPFRPRTDAQPGTDRPHRPLHRDDRNAERPMRSHRDGAGHFQDEGDRPNRDGERPLRPRRFDTSFEDRPRVEREGGRSRFEPRFDERRENRPDRGAPRRPERKSGPKSEVQKAVAPPQGEGAYVGDRIAKVIARAGLGSRRDAETWIEEGRVAVNGETLTSAARNVIADDKITVDGKLLPKRERTRLWLYHKPRGLVTTEKDPEGRPTVFENLDPSLPRVMSVGRLDINTEGLLLLTNDGGLARQLELPKTGWLRRYRVRVFGETDQAQLDKLFEGLTIDGVDYGRIEARLDKEQGANAWLTLGLREGKNREVKNVLGSIGLDVNRLIRVSYGPFQLGELAEGTVEEVKTRVLIDQLGPDLIAEAECEFEAPVYERAEEMATKPASGKPAPGRPGKDGPRRGLRVKAEDGAHERVMRGGLIEDRHGRRVLVQRVADVPEDKPAKRAKPYRDRGGEFSFKPRPSFKDRDRDGGGERPRPSFRDRDSGAGDRPFKPRPSFRDREEGSERPRPSLRDRNEGGSAERPFKPRPSFRDRGEGSERPRPSLRDRNEGGSADRPFKPRPSFRDRDEGGERPRPSFRDRNEGGGERPFKPRPSFRDRDEGGDRPRSSSRDRDGGGDRPFKPRPPSFRERNEGGSDRPFKPRRFEDRAEGGERPFKPRFGGRPGGEKFGGAKPFGASKGPPRGRPGGRPPGGRPPGRGPRRDD